MSRQAAVKPNDIPEGWSPEAADFVNKVDSILTYSCFKENQ